MNAKEKLIELLEKKKVDVLTPCPKKANCSECEYGTIENCRTHELADYLIANGVTVQENTDHFVDTNKMEYKWISIKDKLPNDGQKVLCLCQSNIFDVLKWDSKQWGWIKDSNHNYFRTFVTHWMPLPEPPKGEPNG